MAQPGKQANEKELSESLTPATQSDRVPITHLPKPVPYSALVKERQSIDDEFYQQHNGPKKPTTAEKSNLIQRLNNVNKKLGPALPLIAKQAPAVLSHSNQQQLPWSYALPTEKQIQSMTTEQLRTLKKETQEKLDGVGGKTLKGLERNKHFATLGYIAAQLKLTSEQPRLSNVNKKLGPALPLIAKQAPAVLSHSNQQQLPWSYALPTEKQIQSMTTEQLRTLKKETQEKLDGVGGKTLKGLERNKHFATLGYIAAQLKLTSEQPKKPDAPKTPRMK